MPPRQRGSFFRTKRGEWGVRWLEGGRRQQASPFPSKKLAAAHFDDVVRPRLGLGVPERDLTFDVLCDRYLRVHAVSAQASTITTLRERLKRARDEFGDLQLRDLERMSMEIAAWRASLPEGSRYGITQAVRQTLDAAVRWRLIQENPARLAGKNPQGRRGELTPFQSYAEIDQLAVELGWDPAAGRFDQKGAIAVFGCETGLRPEEWIPLERRDIQRRDRVLLVQRTYTARGGLQEIGKTSKFRRRVPLSDRAMFVLDHLPARLDSRLVFPAPGGGGGVKAGHGGFFDLHNYRSRDWLPAFDSAGLQPRRIYDMRHTFATFALDAGLSLYEVARYMGTSVRMIDLTYGHLAAGAELTATDKLNARARAAAAPADDQEAADA